MVKKKDANGAVAVDASLTTSTRGAMARNDWQLLAGINVVAAAVRLYGLGFPSSVVFDEVHFGGFASKYIHGMFFMDVHPPLAKMLFALFGWLAGFDGDFKFKDIGDDYLEPGVPYVAMRLYPALLGLAIVSTAFLTLRASGCSRLTATLASMLVTFENGLLTNARLILLDSPLIFFTAGTALAFQKFSVLDEQPERQLTRPWWRMLFLTGLFLGATVSTKWVGLFTIAWVGLVTVYQLFAHLGDLRIPISKLAKVFAARFFCLVVVPVAFYMNMFAIHFVCLVNPGGGEGFMSSEFTSTLQGRAQPPTLGPVGYGNTISLRHFNTQGGYLHSHAAAYPGGSKQQQITCYPHKDANNDWMLYNETNSYDPVSQAPVVVRNNAVVKLWHPTTQKRLHSHDVRPIVTEVDWQNEASCYGFEGFDGDANDLFRVEIQPEYTPKGEAREILTAIHSKFRLIHVMTGCALFSHKVKLPSWGFEQQEVTCNKQGTIPNSIWYIESNDHPLAPEDTPLVTYTRPGFFSKFWELQRVMWETNAGLVESHNWDSRPPSWPLLQRGINFWGKEHRHVYLLGNAFIWALSSIAVVVYVAAKALGVLRWQRGYDDYRKPSLWNADYRTGVFVLGWAFHYLPFYLMQRQLFLHHYFPALYFAILTFAQVFDFATRPLPKQVRQAVVVAIVAVSVAVWWQYAPISYGLNWTKERCEKSKLLSTWDFDCNVYPDTLAEYAQIDADRLNAAKVTPSHDAQNTGLEEGEAPKPKPVDQLGVPDPEAVDTHGVQPPAEQVGAPAEAAAAEPESPSPVASVPPGFDAQALGAKGVSVLSQETIFQDENGNQLDPEQVKQMQNVKFVTRYDTVLAGERLPNGQIAGAQPAQPKQGGENYAGQLAKGPDPNSAVPEGEEDPKGNIDSGKTAPAHVVA